MKEDHPNFLVTDGYFFVKAYFTKEAVEDFRSKYSPAVKITSLADRVVVLTQWTLDLVVRN